MNILHVIPSIGPSRGGPSFVVRTMAESQRKLGLKADVLTTDDDGIRRTGQWKNSPLVEREVVYWIFPRQIRFYTFSWPLTRWLRMNVSKYDVVHIHALFSYASTVAALCAEHASVPYVVRPLGVLNRWGVTNRRPLLKRLSIRCIESRILRRAAAVHYTSEQEAAEAAMLGISHNQVVIPNPVRIPKPSSRSEIFRAKHRLDNRPLVLFLSRLDPKKGLDILLSAFHRIQDRHPEAVLAIAGNGDEAFVAGLKKSAADLGLNQSVIWVGFLEGEEKQSALADADLFALPSYSENFGVAAVEAMGAGLPVIVSDQVGIHREILRSGAGLVTECSADTLAAALDRALGDPDWRACAAVNGRQAAAQFEPESVSAQLEDLYRRVGRVTLRPAVA